MDSPNSIYAVEIQKRLEGARNYYRWIYLNIEKFLGNRILEIGCGGGHFTKLLATRDCFLAIADTDDGYIDAVKSEHIRMRQFLAFRYDLNEYPGQELKNCRFDTIVCLNVLEHIKDDLAALRNMRDLIIPSGKLVLMVPAFPCLYGTMDQADQHFRRYSKIELLEKISQVGLQIVMCRYMNILGFFGWFVNGRILKRVLLPEAQLKMYDRFIPIIRRIESLFVPPFGQSLLAVLAKGNKVELTLREENQRMFKQLR